MTSPSFVCLLVRCNKVRGVSFKRKTMTVARVVGLSIFNGVLSAFGSVMNFTVAFVIFKNKDLRKGLNLLILSLSLADLLTNALAQPMYIYLLVNEKEKNLHALKKVFQFFAFVSLHASTNNLAAITLYRLRALSRLFRHIILITRKQAWIVIVIVWMLAGIMAVTFDIEPGKSAAPFLHLAVRSSVDWKLHRYFRFLQISSRKRKSCC